MVGLRNIQARICINYGLHLKEIVLRPQSGTQGQTTLN